MIDKPTDKDILKQALEELMKGITEKEKLANQLLNQAAHQKQLLSLIPSLIQYPASTYTSFLQNWQQQNYLLLRVKGEGPIWLSRNLEVSDWECWSIGEGTLQSSLSTEVHQLQSNLEKYENVIASLKELKQMQQIERQQEENIRDAPSREVKLKRYIDKIEKEMLDCHAQIKSLKGQKASLLDRIRLYQEREKDRREMAELQNRFKQANEVALSEPPRRRHKKILLNY